MAEEWFSRRPRRQGQTTIIPQREESAVDVKGAQNYEPHNEAFRDRNDRHSPNVSRWPSIIEWRDIIYGQNRIA